MIKVINESEDLPLNPPSRDNEYITSRIYSAINDEYKTIDVYNSLSLLASDMGLPDVADVINDICTEENKHVGQLEEVLMKLAPNAEAIDSGRDEGEEQLNS